MNTNCTSEDYASLKKNEFMCCSHHLTSFAVGESFEVSTGRYEKTIAALVTLNAFLVVSMIIGSFLDVKKVLIFDKADIKANLSNADGAAAVEQSSTAMEMSANIAAGG